MRRNSIIYTLMPIFTETIGLFTGIKTPKKGANCHYFKRKENQAQLRCWYQQIKSKTSTCSNFFSGFIGYRKVWWIRRPILAMQQVARNIWHNCNAGNLWQNEKKKCSYWSLKSIILGGAAVLVNNVGGKMGLHTFSLPLIAGLDAAFLPFLYSIMKKHKLLHQ